MFGVVGGGGGGGGGMTLRNNIFVYIIFIEHVTVNSASKCQGYKQMPTNICTSL